MRNDNLENFISFIIAEVLCQHKNRTPLCEVKETIRNLVERFQEKTLSDEEFSKLAKMCDLGWDDL